MTVLIDRPADVNLDSLRRVALGGEGVRLSARALEVMAAAHAAFQEHVARHEHSAIYMVTTGAGPDAGRRYGLEEAQARRRRPRPFLGLSFGGGTLPEYVSRATVLASLPMLVSGATAAHPARALSIASSLDGPLARLPARGLVAAGELMPRFILRTGGPEGIFPGEGFSAGLGNGSPASHAMAGLTAIFARRRVDLVEGCLALSIEAFRAPLDACDARLGELWRDPFASAALEALASWLEDTGGERRQRSAPAAYRILPRLLGQARRAVWGLEEVATCGLRSVVSNPTFLLPTGQAEADVLSTGGFHDAAAAPAVDAVSAAWVDLAAVAQRHIVKLHRGAVSGLPDRLLPPGTDYTTGHSTTYLEYVPNQAVEEMRRLAQPTLLSPAEVAASEQDDVAITAPIAFLSEREVAARLDEVLAVLAATCSQALHVTGRDVSPKLRDVLAFVRAHIQPIESRRPLGEECGRLAAAFAAAVEQGPGTGPAWQVATERP